MVITVRELEAENGVRVKSPTANSHAKIASEKQARKSLVKNAGEKHWTLGRRQKAVGGKQKAEDAGPPTAHERCGKVLKFL
jgi:hypothetical protein